MAATQTAVARSRLWQTSPLAPFSFAQQQQRRHIAVGDGSASGPCKFSRSPYRAFLLDMDGVLHQFGMPIPGAKAFLEDLLRQEVPFCVITNECRYTKAKLQSKLKDILGVNLPLQQIYTAANAVSDFFARSCKNGWRGNILVIGEAGLQESVAEALADYPDCRMIPASEDDDSHCDFVCVGTIFTGGPNDSWTSAERASTYLKKGAKLVYSNPDWFEVTAAGAYKFGCPMPVVNLLMQTTGCSSYNLGKPNPFMLRQAHEHLVHAVLSPLSPNQRSFVQGHIDLSDVLFVGDSINTDVRIALENNIDVALVLSGTTTVDQLKLSALQPNYVFENIEALHTSLTDGSLGQGGRHMI